MVELGVAKGNFAVDLMRANRNAWYIGIDRYAGDRGHDGKQYREARGRIGHLGGNLYRGTFAEELPIFKDEECDLVYVDGYAHTGQDNGQTLEQWWPKVKPGGIFAGHDYHPRWQATIEAVNAFTRDHGLEKDLRIIREERGFDSWWILKPFDSPAVT